MIENYLYRNSKDFSKKSIRIHREFYEKMLKNKEEKGQSLVWQVDRALQMFFESQEKGENNGK